LKKILIYGYGNPGRQDDALGVLLTTKMENWSKKHKLNIIQFDTNYQLNIEDALLISEYDMVIFADASIEEISHYTISRVIPNPKAEFSMHAISPEFVLYLCQKLYNKHPETYLLHLKGYEFEFLSQLTQKAKNNLEMAFGFLTDVLEQSIFPVDLIENYIQDKEELKIN